MTSDVQGEEQAAAGDVDAPAMDERIAARRAEVRRAQRRRRLRRTLTLLVVLLAGVAAWVVDRSSVVALASVEVTGVERLTVGQVRAAAGLPVGSSTLRLPLAAARDRVTEIPAVDSAEVVRREPVVLEIRVEERQPVLQVTSRGGSAVLDADNVVFGPFCVACGDDTLPEVVVEGGVPTMGTEAGPLTPLGNAAVVAAELRPDLLAEVQVLRAPVDLDAFSVVLAEGTEVLIGRADRLPEKLRALDAVRSDLGARQVTTIDVRTPLAPVVRN